VLAAEIGDEPREHPDGAGRRRAIEPIEHRGLLQWAEDEGKAKSRFLPPVVSARG
jgi:hypothetical protein